MRDIYDSPSDNWWTDATGRGRHVEAELFLEGMIRSVNSVASSGRPQSSAFKEDPAGELSAQLCDGNDSELLYV